MNETDELFGGGAELVRLVYWDGFSLEQAADHLGIPASTARGRHAKAKQRPRQALTRGVVPVAVGPAQ